MLAQRGLHRLALDAFKVQLRGNWRRCGQRDRRGGGAAERLTFDGAYNVSPRYAPDGKSFVFIQRSGGRFNVAVQDFVSRQAQSLTENGIDESPSFAPNGRIILYATEVKGRGILSAVSSDGRVRQRFSADAGDVREPAWGPLTKNP